MSFDNPYFKKEDFEVLRDGMKYYIDYLRANDLDRSDPKHYKHAYDVHLRTVSWCAFWKQYPQAGDLIEIQKPRRVFS